MVEDDVNVRHTGNLLRYGCEEGGESRDRGCKNGDATELRDDLVQLREAGSQSTEEIVERSDEIEIYGAVKLRSDVKMGVRTTEQSSPEKDAVPKDVLIVFRGDYHSPFYPHHSRRNGSNRRQGDENSSRSNDVAIPRDPKAPFGVQDFGEENRDGRNGAGNEDSCRYLRNTSSQTSAWHVKGED